MLDLLKHKFFKKPEGKPSGNGLFATVEELMEQRNFIKYLKFGKKTLSKSHQAGDVKSAFKGRGIELEEIREYVFGDDIRDIDWRVTARRQEPYTKLYAEERDREVYVFLDLSPSMIFGTKKELKSVTASKITALLGWLSLDNKDRFGAVIFDGFKSFLFKPQNNRANMLAILNKVSELTKEALSKKQDDTNGLQKALHLLKQSIKSRAIVFVISDFEHLDDVLKKSISAMSKNASIYCINVMDVLEEKAPKAGEYMAVNGADSLVFATAEPNFNKEYRTYFQGKRKRVKDFCNKFRLKYVEVRTNQEIYDQIRI